MIHQPHERAQLDGAPYCDGELDGAPDCDGDCARDGGWHGASVGAPSRRASVSPPVLSSVFRSQVFLFNQEEEKKREGRKKFNLDGRPSHLNHSLTHHTRKLLVY